MKQIHKRQKSSRDDVTIFCAVYSKDPNRYELLESHRECLAKQSIEVNPLYIFESGDNPPNWLDARSIVYPTRLSIYQAWQVGMERSRTKHVGNLNLDDRFLVTGVEALSDTLLASGGTLAGGEWNIFFSRAEVDQAVNLLNDTKLSETEIWPPASGQSVSLGSGSGRLRGTYGPATLVDKSKFRFCYPTRFKNGALIESIGDAIFWSALKQLGHQCERTSQVVGRYLSNPSQQAEFRKHQDHELLKYGVLISEISDPTFDAYRAPYISAKDFPYEM